MPCCTGRWARSCCCVTIACLALVGCTRFGYGRLVDTEDGAPGGADVRADGVPLDTNGEASDVDGFLRDSAGVEGGSQDWGPVADLPPPATGLVAAWLLDEGSGQTVSGAPGSPGFLGKNSGADGADPSWDKTPARICSGAALTFDGDDDVITIPGASPAGLAAFTITFSLYVTGNGGGGLPRILTKENGGDSDTIVHYRSMSNAIAVNMFDTADTLYATFAAGVVTAQRANWALTYDDAGDRRLHAYKNGKETTYLRQDVLAGTLRTTTNPWRIGNEATGVRGFDGTIDDVRVFNRVLDPAEIAALSALCPP
jgi:hypothetical protein